MEADSKDAQCVYLGLKAWSYTKQEVAKFGVQNISAFTQRQLH